MANNPFYKTEWCEFVVRSHGCRFSVADCKHAHSWADYLGTDIPDWPWHNEDWCWDGYRSWWNWARPRGGDDTDARAPEAPPPHREPWRVTPANQSQRPPVRYRPTTGDVREQPELVPPACVGRQHFFDINLPANHVISAVHIDTHVAPAVPPALVSTDEDWGGAADEDPNLKIGWKKADRSPT